MNMDKNIWLGLGVGLLLGVVISSMILGRYSVVGGGGEYFVKLDKWTGKTWKKTPMWEDWQQDKN